MVTLLSGMPSGEAFLSKMIFESEANAKICDWNSNSPQEGNGKFLDFSCA